MKKRDVSERILGLLEVFMRNPGITMNLQTINMNMHEMGHSALPRSTFFRLMRKINLEQNAFKIIASRGSVTERGYKLEVQFDAGNSFSELYKRINTELYEKIAPYRVFADDDSYYYALDPILDKINEALKYKQTISFSNFGFDTVKPSRINDVTPMYIVIKPNKVWLYYTENQVPKKCNLFLISDVQLTEGTYDHLPLNDFKEKYLNKHGYFKNELKKWKAEFTSLEKHIKFHRFLSEQNFQRYYKSWKSKDQEKYFTEFESLSEEQIYLFKTIAESCRKK